jgi:hypothetical protein
MTKESLQLTVPISGGFAGAYEQLLPESQRMSSIKVTTGSGASQGLGSQTIAAQFGRGVAADVVILSREGLSQLIAAKMIAAGTDVDLARVRLGATVRAGNRKPDLSTVEGFEQALLQARSVAIPRSTGGIWLTHDLFPALGTMIRWTQRRRLSIICARSKGIIGSGILRRSLWPGRAHPIPVLPDCGKASTSRSSVIHHTAARASC